MANGLEVLSLLMEKDVVKSEDVRSFVLDMVKKGVLSPQFAVDVSNAFRPGRKPINATLPCNFCGKDYLLGSSDAAVIVAHYKNQVCFDEKCRSKYEESKQKHRKMYS